MTRSVALEKLQARVVCLLVRLFGPGQQHPALDLHERGGQDEKLAGPFDVDQLCQVEVFEKLVGDAGDGPDGEVEPSRDFDMAHAGGEVRIEVRDQGKGIAPDKRLELLSAGTPGVGIRGMRERLRQLGGTMEINSDGDGSGTQVVVRLPIGHVGSNLSVGASAGSTH